MNNSVILGGGYRGRVERKLQRQAAKAKSDREDMLAYVEPQLREYEAAFYEANGTPISCEYVSGWVEITHNGQKLNRIRLKELVNLTATLQARVHEAVITNREDA